MKQILFFIALISCLAARAQVDNSSMEVIDYREVDGKIILDGVLNGKPVAFALDLSGHKAILSEYLEQYGIDPGKAGNFPYQSYVCRDYTPVGSVEIDNVTVGNTVSARATSFFTLKEAPYLKKLGVVGTIDATLFQSGVMTIDRQRKKITVTAPYRPQYMQLTSRQNARVTAGVTVSTEAQIDGHSCTLVLDTWSDATVSLTPADYARLMQGKAATGEARIAARIEGNSSAGKQAKAAKLVFVKSEITGVAIAENPSLKRSVTGLGLLNEGLVSIDFAKEKIYFQPYGLVAIDDAAFMPPAVVIEDGKLNPITRDYFVEHIFDYRKGGEFVSKSDKPIVIDFWATWCGPCMRLLPEMEKMAAKYKGKVIFCKVNADKEKELCNIYGVSALPTMFFIPAGGKPIIDVGATAQKYEEIIKQKLLKERDK